MMSILEEDDMLATSLLEYLRIPGAADSLVEADAAVEAVEDGVGAGVTVDAVVPASVAAAVAAAVASAAGPSAGTAFFVSGAALVAVAAATGARGSSPLPSDCAFPIACVSCRRERALCFPRRLPTVTAIGGS